MAAIIGRKAILAARTGLHTTRPPFPRTGKYLASSFASPAQDVSPKQVAIEQRADLNKAHKQCIVVKISNTKGYEKGATSLRAVLDKSGL